MIRSHRCRRTTTPPRGAWSKVIVLGSSNVGKTSLMRRFTQGQFTGAARRRRVPITYQSVSCCTARRSYCRYDTAGQERFHHGTLGAAFYRGWMRSSCTTSHDRRAGRAVEGAPRAHHSPASFPCVVSETRPTRRAARKSRSIGPRFWLGAASEASAASKRARRTGPASTPRWRQSRCSPSRINAGARGRSRPQQDSAAIWQSGDLGGVRDTRRTSAARLRVRRHRRGGGLTPEAPRGCRRDEAQAAATRRREDRKSPRARGPACRSTRERQSQKVGPRRGAAFISLRSSAPLLRPRRARDVGSTCSRGRCELAAVVLRDRVVVAVDIQRGLHEAAV